MKNSFLKLHCLSVVCLFCTLLLASCDNSDEPAPQSTDPLITDVGTSTGTPSNFSVGTAGGTLQSADGKLTVIIPAGALSSTTTLSIQPISNEGPLGVGFGYRLKPEGLSFSKPVTLQFHYDEQFLQGIPADFLWIITQTGNGSWNALLKSFVSTATKTVTIETTHFSDWALGRFIDLTLDPVGATIKKGQSIELHVTGFLRDLGLSDEEELAPLTLITSDGEGLAPLTPIPPIESRFVEFKVKGWTLNGVSAPVSNSNGSLSASMNKATYTAPGKKPTTNPVAVSVTLESNNKEGMKASYMLTSNITVLESDLFLLVTIGGHTYEYIQYGSDPTAPPDPNNIWMVNCSFSDNSLAIVGGLFSTEVKYSFVLEVENPSEGTRGLDCESDQMEFIPTLGERTLILPYTERKLSNNTCDNQSRCSVTSLTFLTYTGESNSIVSGNFSGKLYDDKPGYSDQCKTADEISVNGEFRLVLIK